MEERSTTRREPPAFSPHTLWAQYLNGHHDALSEGLLVVLRHFRDVTYPALDGQAQRYVDAYCKHFLTLFTQSDFTPKREHLVEFVHLNATISNLVAMSCFGKADPFLTILANTPGALGKLLALCSARNRLELDRPALLSADLELAHVWYAAYGELYRTGLLDPVVWENLRVHFAFDDARLNALGLPMYPYFASTYVGDHRDRNVRGLLNRSWKREVAALQAGVRNRPNPQKIAIISSSWSRVHSAYRITRAYVEALEGYHLTFVPIGSRKNLDLSGFHEVRPLGVDASGAVDVQPILENDFAAIFYPDVGLSPTAVMLTNLRLAPVQMASLGHSVSTWGAEVDYFFSGSLVEPPDHPERNYSERLVLLPRLGAVHEYPDYTPSGLKASASECILNCSWNAQKLSYPFGLTLRRIVEGLDRPVRFRIFVSASLNRQNDLMPFLADFRRAVPDAAFEVVREQPYRDYMALLEQGSFSLDSYPFGGCNTVVDSLFLRRLIVCREGDVWYNRVGPAMLRMIGLPELVATNDDDYVTITRRLILDEPFRAELQGRLDRVDLDTTLFDRSEARVFRRAVDYLIAHHEILRSEPDRSPLRFDAQ